MDTGLPDGFEPFLKTTSETSSEMDSEVILITGAGESIGPALAHALLRDTSAHVVLLDVSEQNLHRVGVAVRVLCHKSGV